MKSRSRRTFAPFNVWATAAVIVYSFQIIGITSILWTIAAMIDATDQVLTIGLPSIWIAGPAIILGSSSPTGSKRWQLDTIAGLIAYKFAGLSCPVCEQDIFDPTSPTGYATMLDRQAWLPSRICANCGHDFQRLA